MERSATTASKAPPSTITRRQLLAGAAGAAGAAVLHRAGLAAGQEAATPERPVVPPDPTKVQGRAAA